MSVCLATAVLTALAACSGSDAAPATTLEPTAPTDEITDPAGDDRLRVGVILPLTGAGSELGTVMLDAVELAVQQVDDLGVQGRDVEIVVVDEAKLERATPTLEGLFTDEVDAVIGPASSLVAERLLPILVSAGVLTCSPTASARSLDDFPDTQPLFIRTIPSDSLQAKALARQLDGTGTDIVLAFVEDAYGEPLVELVRRELVTQGAPVPKLIGFDPEQPDYSSIAREIADSGAATIGIIGDPEAGPRLVQSLAEVIDPTLQSSIWMNDAMRVPATASVYRRLDDAVLAIMRGVSPRSSIADPELARTFPEDGRLFAANAYDCMNVIALAAEQADFINGGAMAAQIVPTTTGGTPCGSFPSCMAQLGAGRGIDYNGPTNDLDIAADGDPTTGIFDIYRFEGGLDVTDASWPAQRVSG